VNAPAPHPSFLELDRHALGAGRADTAAHVASCETCRARLIDIGQVGPASDAPAWALRLEPRQRPLFGWLTARRVRPLGWGVTAFACVFALWLASGHLGTRPIGTGVDSYVGTKGGPALWLYVKHGERIDIWNGTDPVHPGDLLRLKVQPARYRHISVFTASGKTPAAYARLYDGPVAAPTALPFSWKVDAQPGDETLVVVLASESVSPDEVANVLTRGDDGRRWSRRFVLAKVGAREGARP